MKRINTVFIFFILAYLLIALRLFYWQFINREQLLVQASSQYFQRFEIPAKRGDILASDGFPLATNEPAFSVYAILPELKNPITDVAAKLALIIVKDRYKDRNLDEKSLEEKVEQEENNIESKLAAKNVVWVQLARKISQSAKSEMEALNISGLNFQPEFRRYYPEASMGAHILGFVGFDKYGKDIGYFGLEGYYNNQLKGRPGFLRQERDATGKPIVSQNYQAIPPEDGRTIKTTIDRTVQFIVERELERAVTKYQAKAGSVLVMEPSTGKILAMASYPSYNPNNWQDYAEEEFKNPLVADSYEPGSTFKVIVMAAAINEKIVKPDTICEKCDGPRQIGGFTIRTWNDKYYPNSNMVQILEHSDNVGMVYVAEKLGIRKLIKYISDFGFGHLTNIDLQDESTVKLRPVAEWKEIDGATASFGQGIAVTPIQMVQAVAAIANGGKLMEPFVVEKIVGGAKEFERQPKIVRQVIDASTAKIITEMMVAAVDNGEARVFKPKGFRIAGKTGTAQIAVEGHYDPHKTIASFIGFAPANNPRFLMLVRFLEPTTSRFGSETAAPTFFSIAKELFAYFGITPEN